MARLSTAAGAVRWPLAAAWSGTGALAGVALADPFGMVLLLVSTGGLAAWLLWSFDAGPEVGAALVGLGVLPVVLAVRARHHACAVVDELACDPEPSWPWLVLALALLLAGSAVVVAPLRTTRTAPPATG